VYAVTNGRASLTDYSKANRVRKFYTTYTGVVATYTLQYIREFSQCLMFFVNSSTLNMLGLGS